MKTFKLLRMTMAAGVLLAAASGAQACEVWRDDISKVWRANCNLTIDLKAPKVIQHFIMKPPGPWFRMPDLHIHKYTFEVFNGELWVYADIDNFGLLNASATNVGITITVLDPNGVVANRTIVPMPLPAVPAITATTRSRVYLTKVPLSYDVQDWDILVSGMVDQLTVAQPVRGSLFESDETNNSLMYMCRVYGPNPNMSTTIDGCL